MVGHAVHRAAVVVVNSDAVTLVALIALPLCPRVVTIVSGVCSIRVAVGTDICRAIEVRGTEALRSVGTGGVGEVCGVAVCTGITVGTVVYLFWALFINSSMSVFMPICKWITGNAVLFPNTWLAFCDPMVIALPLSIAVFVIVRLINKSAGKDSQEAPASQ